MKKTIIKPQTDIDISELAKGLYFLKMESNDKTEVMKFVKEKCLRCNLKIYNSQLAFYSYRFPYFWIKLSICFNSCR